MQRQIYLGFGLVLFATFFFFFLTREKFMDLEIQEITSFAYLELQLTETIYFQEHYLYAHLSIKPCYVFIETATEYYFRPQNHRIN